MPACKPTAAASLGPGDLLTYIPEGSGCTLIGIVVSRHQEISGMEEIHYGLEGPTGPGVGIYWQTTNRVAYWPFAEMQVHMDSGAMALALKVRKN